MQKKKRGHTGSVSTSGQISASAGTGTTGQEAVDSRQDRAVARLENRVKRGEWWIICLTAATVVIGAMQWYLAREQASLAKSTFALDQRAWVTAEAIENTPSAGCEFIPSVKIRNTGKTPALQLEGSLRLLSLKRGQGISVTPSDPPYRRDPNSAQSKAVLPAGGHVYLSTPVLDPNTNLPLIVTADMSDRYRNGDEVLYVVGYVTYNDIFKKPHWLKFCGKYAENQWAFCNEFSGMDEG